MRLFLVVALVAAVIALICAAVPTLVLTLGPVGWISVSLIAYFVDLLIGQNAILPTTRA